MLWAFFWATYCIQNREKMVYSSTRLLVLGSVECRGQISLCVLCALHVWPLKRGFIPPILFYSIFWIRMTFFSFVVPQSSSHQELRMNNNTVFHHTEKMLSSVISRRTLMNADEHLEFELYQTKHLRIEWTGALKGGSEAYLLLLMKWF